MEGGVVVDGRIGVEGVGVEGVVVVELRTDRGLNEEQQDWVETGEE